MPDVNFPNKWPRFTKPAVAVCAAGLLTTCAPLPSTIDQIKALGELRVVTQTGPLAFYRGADGMPEGPEYELARRFADELGVRLKMITVGTYTQIYSALRSGQAHLAAAGLKIPAQPITGIEFGPAYQFVSEHLVYRHGSKRPELAADIGAGELAVARQESGMDILRQLDAVAQGRIGYTVADSTEFALAHDVNPQLRIASDFGGRESLAWAASERDPGFVRAMNGYFGRINLDGELTAIVHRYYGRAERVEFGESEVFLHHLQSRLPLYRQWFEEAAEQSREDWRLLAAIGYQESKWDPRAANPSGARGLMQLTHQTAGETNVSNPIDARQSIFGGARYFRQVYEKIPAHVPEPDRTWFALAAYNIGYGHLEDARVLAQKAGRDPDSWQDVREFLPLLAEEHWYSQTENGYARGWEPVRYVDNVRGYRDLLEWVWGSTASLN
jgi:membrane-bound lytic murein transglycosylase F